MYFVQGEQLRPVLRRGRTAREAVRQLIAGPTRTERRHGFRTYVPAGTRLRSVSVAKGLATVDLSHAFAKGGRSAGSMLARLSELVGTVTGIQGTKRVKLLIDGQFVENVTRDPIDRSMVEAIGQVAWAMGIETIAERVESEEVLVELGKLGIGFAQGYHIARPRPTSEFPYLR